ncbi:MAG: hypothetical protein PHP74_00680 [Candidatus Gracilibacteria bacterium]|nr:hypothetical protein [Candidatus Gracilibacteria bacterium]
MALDIPNFDSPPAIVQKEKSPDGGRRNSPFHVPSSGQRGNGQYLNNQSAIVPQSQAPIPQRVPPAQNALVVNTSKKTASERGERPKSDRTHSRVPRTIENAPRPANAVTALSSHIHRKIGKQSYAEGTTPENTANIPALVRAEQRAQALAEREAIDAIGSPQCTEDVGMIDIQPPTRRELVNLLIQQTNEAVERALENMSGQRRPTSEYMKKLVYTKARRVAKGLGLSSLLIEDGIKNSKSRNPYLMVSDLFKKSGENHVKKIEKDLSRQRLVASLGKFEAREADVGQNIVPHSDYFSQDNPEQDADVDFFDFDFEADYLAKTELERLDSLYEGGNAFLEPKMSIPGKPMPEQYSYPSSNDYILGTSTHPRLTAFDISELTGDPSSDDSSKYGKTF